MSSMSSLFYLLIVGDIGESSNYIVYHNSYYSNGEIPRINTLNYMKLQIKALY